MRDISTDNGWLLRKGHGLMIGETFFKADLPRISRCDIFRINYSSLPLPKGFSKKRATIVLDLLRDENTIFQSFHKNTRIKIRRAEKDGILHQIVKGTTDEAIRFGREYVLFARRNSLPENIMSRLSGLAAMGRLTLSHVTDQTGALLTQHAYYENGFRYRMIYSLMTASYLDQPSSFVNRVNRYHHWCDITAFKRSGAHEYDLGGFYLGHKDKKKLAINDFKQSFGGSVISEYSTVIPCSWKGWLAAPLMVATM